LYFWPSDVFKNILINKKFINITFFIQNYSSMKNHVIFLIAVLFINTASSAQRFKQEDTVVVLQVARETGNGTSDHYLPYKIKNVINWVDQQNVRHKSVLRKINPGFLMLDTAIVYPTDIKGVSMAPPFGFMPSQPQMISNVIPDSSGKFLVMTFMDFEILSKKAVLASSQQNQSRNPFFNNVNSEKEIADLEKQKQRRISMFAALDTCPVHYGISTNLVRDLTNEINLNFELPVKRSFCLEFGAGILYATPDPKACHFAGLLSEKFRIRNRNLSSFDHSYLFRKGFSLEVIPKFFLSKKKHLYLGPQLGFHYYYYSDKLIWLNADGSDYYHRSFYALQSEKSAAVNLNFLLGVQTPQIKKFLFDAFFSIGMTYRGGIVTRSLEMSYGSSGSHTDFLDPPQMLKVQGWELSVQLGFKIGWRFGKAKLYG